MWSGDIDCTFYKQLRSARVMVSRFVFDGLNALHSSVTLCISLPPYCISIFCDDCYPIFFAEEVPELLSRYNTLRDALEELLQLNREVNIDLQNRLHFRLYTTSIRFSDFRIILCSYSSLISPSVYLAREWDWWISYKITNFQNCDAK